MTSCVLDVDVDEAPPVLRHQDDPDHPHLTDRLLNKCQEKEQTNCDVQIGDGMDIVIVGENGETDICVSISFEILEINFVGDVKNPKLSMALNHLPGNNIIMSSFNNIGPFQNPRISEYPFNDSLR